MRFLTINHFLQKFRFQAHKCVHSWVHQSLPVAYQAVGLYSLHGNHCNQTQVLVAFYLTHLRTACLLTHFTIEDSAEPCLPRRTPPFWRGRPPQPSVPQLVSGGIRWTFGLPWIQRAVIPDTRWYLSCAGATAEACGLNREWFLIPGYNTAGWERPNG